MIKGDLALEWIKQIKTKQRSNAFRRTTVCLMEILSERLWIPPIGGFYFYLENKTVEIYHQLFFKVTVNVCTSAEGFSFTKKVKKLQSEGQYYCREPFTRNFSYISREKKKNNKGLRKIIIVNGPHMVFFLCVFLNICVFLFASDTLE